MPARRILLIIEAASAGAGRHVLDLAEGLIASGNEVDLVYSPLRSSRYFEERVRAIPFAAVKILPMCRAPGVGDVATLARLIGWLRTRPAYDVIHGHSSKAGALARLAGLAVNSPIVYTPHAFITMDPFLGIAARTAFTAVEKGLALLGDAVVAVSRVEFDHAIAMGLRRDQVFFVPNELDLPAPVDRAAARARFGLGDDVMVIGSACRFAKQKGLDCLIDAFHTLHRQRPETRLMLVGWGPDQESLRARVAGHGLGDAVIFAGRQESCELTAAFDIYAQTSLYETRNYSLMEAMGLGLPVVSTMVGGADELIVPGKGGFIVANDPVTKTAGMADRLLWLAERREALATMGAFNRDMIASGGTARMAARTFEVYEAVHRARTTAALLPAAEKTGGAHASGHR